MAAVGVLFFGGAAVFHLIAVFKPDISEPLPVWEHGLFVLINAFFAVAFVLRAPWVGWPFLALTLQQLWSHGGDFVRALQETPPRFDFQSFFALAGLGLVWVVLFLRKKFGQK